VRGRGAVRDEAGGAIAAGIGQRGISAAVCVQEPAAGAGAETLPGTAGGARDDDAAGCAGDLLAALDERGGIGSAEGGRVGCRLVRRGAEDEGLYFEL